MALLLKDLYNKQYIDYLSTSIQQIYPAFNTTAFQSAVFNASWKAYELKERMRHISTLLGKFLPQEYIKAIDILRTTFNKCNHAYALENMIFQDFVEVYGLEFFDTSMLALETFTVGSSSEFAIRQFILKYEKESMQQMSIWAKSDNEHIRRLASEGCRPRLPWAIVLPAFKKNPYPIIEILELLKDDASAYVRKSVANNLNDISKDNPGLVTKITKEWLGVTKERDALLKHGCRTLLKASDCEVLELFGFSKPKHISLESFTSTQNVKMGEALEFSFELLSQKKLGKLRIEFAIGFLRKNGQCNQKVFKISEGEYEQKSKQISKSYSFKPISTRVYYEGEHKLSIIINGTVFKEFSFLVY